MKNKLKISLVIPCRNEANGIASLIKRASKIFDEVIVVDNCSTDQTFAVAKRAGAKVLKEFKTNANGIGYGYSLIKGMRAARNKIVVTLDGDGTYPLEQIEAVFNHMRNKNLDMVLCSRFPLSDGQAISWWRQLGVWVLNNEVRLLYGNKIEDILSGMWMIKKSALSLLRLKQGGWNLSPEIKLAAIKNKDISCGQFHIRHYEREFDQSKQKLIATGLEHLWFIFANRIQYFWQDLRTLFNEANKTERSVEEAKL